MFGSITILQADRPMSLKLLCLVQIKHATDSCDENLKGKFSERSLSIFWLKPVTVYPELSEIVLSMLWPFSIKNLREAGFSALTQWKLSTLSTGTDCAETTH